MEDEFYLGLTDENLQVKCVDCRVYYDKDDMILCPADNSERCESDQIPHEMECTDCSDEYVFQGM